MNLEALGYNEMLEDYRRTNNLESFEIGRVVLEHRDRYIVHTDQAEYEAELIGNLRFSSESRLDLPAVGDWVALSAYDESKALIHKVFPRHSILKRKAVGKASEFQIIAANLDYGLIVQAVDRNFNINRMERYLTICNDAKIVPVVVLSKIDLISEAVLEEMKRKVKDRLPNTPILTCSLTPNGYKSLKEFIVSGQTYCLLGSSGVGKSTILNHLLGESKMETGAISTSVNKGRHITSHRELVVLDTGGIIIDNPGMREVGIADAQSGMELTFEDIVALSQQCKFKDCSHTNEIGCAILEGLELGEIDEESYANYQKMRRERSHYERDTLDKRRRDRQFGKMIKNIQKERRKNKY